jgi:hypothetical protein
MGNHLIPNLLDVSLCFVALFISVRSFDIYSRSRQSRVFILGLSMVLVSLSAAADFTANYINTSPARAIILHTDWFLYVGQAVGFLFILLSLVWSSDNYLRSLVRLNSVAFALLLLLLLFSPALPSMDILIQTVFNFTRFIACLLIFFVYFTAYMSKPTRFSLFMSISFFFFTADYLMTLEQNYAPVFNQSLIIALADIVGVFGLVMLVGAVSWE